MQGPVPHQIVFAEISLQSIRQTTFQRAASPSSTLWPENSNSDPDHVASVMNSGVANGNT